MTFREILESKLHETPKDAPAQGAFSAYVPPQFVPHFPLWEIPFSPLKQAPFHSKSAYRPSGTSVKKTTTPRPEKTCLTADLSATEQIALQIFIKYSARRVSGALLSESQVKRDYRDLVRKFHPDRALAEGASPSTETFLVIHDAYKTLLSCLK